ILDLAGHLRLHLRRRHAGVTHRDEDEREGDVRLVLHAELRKAEQSAEHQRDEHHDDRNRIPDRPGDEIHLAARAALMVLAALATATVSPSFRNPAPFTTTTSPSATPADTSSMSSCTPACSI